MYTECPHCHAIFRVTQAILQAAGGKVRCGECKTVFQAVHPVPKPAKARKPPVEKSQQTDTPEKETAPSFSDDTPHSENREPLHSEALSETPEATEKALEPVEEVEAVLDTETPNNETSATDKIVANDDPHSIEDDIKPTVSDGVPSEEPVIEEDRDLSIEAVAERLKALRHEQSAANVESELALEAGELEATTEDEEEEKPHNSIEDIHSAFKQKQPDAIAGANTLRHEASVTLPEDPELDLDLALGAEPDKESIPSIETPVGFGELADLRPEELAAPEEPAYTPRPAAKPWMKWLSVVLVLALIAQIIIWNRKTLIEVPGMRPVVTALCTVAGCDIGARRDVTAIELVSHGIYSHPTVPDALMLKAEIANRAEFAQPYPVIQVDFSDIRGKAVALRRFGPSEYLDAASSPPSKMLPGETIPVILEVVDPGKHALAFEFSFL